MTSAPRCTPPMPPVAKILMPGLPGHQGGKIPAAGLGHATAGLAQVFDLLTAQAGLQAAADNSDGGGHRAVFAQRLLHQQSGLHIFRVGHTMGNNGALQGHHGLALCQSLRHFRRYVQIRIHVHH